MRRIEPDWVTTMWGIEMPASPITVDGERLPWRLPPPRLGEHTDEILREVGYSPDGIVALRAAKTVA
jgi:crotonobetainyl-CoA:carnitine CoA-transferase CaiB-like acyl-CoA transferase